MTPLSQQSITCMIEPISFGQQKRKTDSHLLSEKLASECRLVVNPVKLCRSKLLIVVAWCDISLIGLKLCRVACSRRDALL